jgi:hypothetical protein
VYDAMLECATNVCHASVHSLHVVAYANDLGRVSGAMTRNATDVQNSDVQSVAPVHVPCAVYVVVCIGTRASVQDVKPSNVQTARGTVLAHEHDTHAIISKWQLNHSHDEADPFAPCVCPADRGRLCRRLASPPGHAASQHAELPGG